MDSEIAKGTRSKPADAWLPVRLPDGRYIELACHQGGAVAGNALPDDVYIALVFGPALALLRPA